MFMDNGKKLFTSKLRLNAPLLYPLITSEKCA